MVRLGHRDLARHVPADERGRSLYWLEAPGRDRDFFGRGVDVQAHRATRSKVKTAQDKAALRSLFELKDLGDAKSVDLYFGSKAPAGKEGRWIQTVPGKPRFAYFRIYGPQPEAFEGRPR